MYRLWQLMAVFVMATALAASGFARGDDNGGRQGPQNERNEGKGKKGKKGNKGDDGTSRTFRIGEIVINDVRILDLTGDYVLTSGTDSLDLSIVQDERGNLVGTADLVLADLITTVVDVSGRLKASDAAVTFTLVAALSDDDTEEEDEVTTTIRIIGGRDIDADTDSFEVTVEVTSGTETFRRVLGTITPVNTLTGLTIEEGTNVKVRGKGRVIFSERLVTLPWGTEVLRGHQVNANGFKFMAHNQNLRIDIRGEVDSEGEVIIESVRVNLGFGKLDVDPEDVELPAVQ